MGRIINLLFELIQSINISVCSVRFGSRQEGHHVEDRHTRLQKLHHQMEVGDIIQHNETFAVKLHVYIRPT